MKINNKLKPFFRVILVSIITAIACALVGIFIFEGGFSFLPCLLLSGFFMTIVQKEKKAYRFIDKLLIGSLVFGILTMFLISLRMYITTKIYGDYSFPFFFWLQPDSLIMALVFSFCSFLGGLVGIVIKGFYVLCKNKESKLKTLILILVLFFVAITFGVVIPKFTVYDLVTVNSNLKRCVIQSLNTHYDNPIERLGLYLGKSRIISAQISSAEVESFTIFRIPLGVLRGQSNSRLGVFCNMLDLNDSSSSVIQ